MQHAFKRGMGRMRAVLTSIPKSLARSPVWTLDARRKRPPFLEYNTYTTGLTQDVMCMAPILWCGGRDGEHAVNEQVESWTKYCGRRWGRRAGVPTANAMPRCREPSAWSSERGGPGGGGG